MLGSGSVYAGCTVNGVTESGTISLADLKTAIGTGTDDITTCNVSSITNMFELFENNGSFNQDIGSWDVSNVTNMGKMFNNAISFNQDISSWEVGNVTLMNAMFKGVPGTATIFNKNIACVKLKITLLNYGECRYNLCNEKNQQASLQLIEILIV